MASGTVAGAGGQHGGEHQGCEDAVSGVLLWVDLSPRGAFPQLLALPLKQLLWEPLEKPAGTPGWKSQEKGQSATGASPWPTPPLEKA